MYHSAPLQFTLMLTRIGATVVVMEHFDAEHGAGHDRAVRRHPRAVGADDVRAHAQAARGGAEALRPLLAAAAIHVAAPCPIPVKEAMIEWWGPIILEYYAATEGIGVTLITSADWLEHKGSVGKSLLGPVHILDDDDEELPPGEDGRVFFEPPDFLSFEYHNDPAKTAVARSPQGWATVGDVGYVDEEGYLYLTDRSTNMIISGGVNIYPQEAENLLVTHPRCSTGGVRRARRRDGRAGEGRRAAGRLGWPPAPTSSASCSRSAGTAWPTTSARATVDFERAAPPRDRQALQAPPPGPLLGRPREQDRVMELRTIRAEVDDGVAPLTLARPDAGNSIDLRWRSELHEVTTAWTVDPGVRAVLVQGEGSTFCVGGDLKSFAAGADLPAHLTDITTYLHAAISRLAAHGRPGRRRRARQRGRRRLQPRVAADLVLAGASSRFVMAYTAIGLTPDGSGTWALPRVVGLRRALELTLTNRPLTAERGGGRGLATRVVADDDLRDEALALARSLAAGPTGALGAAKRLLRGSLGNDLEAQMALEAELLAGGGVGGRRARASPRSSRSARPASAGRTDGRTEPWRPLTDPGEPPRGDPRVRRQAVRPAGLPRHGHRRDRRGGRHHRAGRVPPLREQERRARRGGRRAVERVVAGVADVVDEGDTRLGGPRGPRAQHDHRGARRPGRLGGGRARAAAPRPGRAAGPGPRPPPPRRGVGPRPGRRPARPDRRRGAGDRPRGARRGRAVRRPLRRGARAGRTEELLQDGDGRPAPHRRWPSRGDEPAALRGGPAEDRGHHHRVDDAREAGVVEAALVVADRHAQRQRRMHDHAGLGLGEVGAHAAHDATHSSMFRRSMRSIQARVSGLSVRRSYMATTARLGLATIAVDEAAGQRVERLERRQVARGDRLHLRERWPRRARARASRGSPPCCGSGGRPPGPVMPAAAPISSMPVAW